MARIEAGAFRRVVRALAPDAARLGQPLPACPRHGFAAYEAVPLALADALAGLDRWTVPALPAEVSRLVRGAAESCASESGDAVWLVLHADGRFDALAPRAYAALAGAHRPVTVAA